MARRPGRARREKPRVSAFTSANIDKIVALKPDLVLSFSDLQADIAADLIRRGLDVHAFNQRSVAGILDMIRTVGAIRGMRFAADSLLEGDGFELSVPGQGRHPSATANHLFSHHLSPKLG
jgi:iron complex transport system substrate-binding protein